MKNTRIFTRAFCHLFNCQLDGNNEDLDVIGSMRCSLRSYFYICNSIQNLHRHYDQIKIVVNMTITNVMRFIVYISQYRNPQYSEPQLISIIGLEMLMLNTSNPRALIYLLKKLECIFADFPGNKFLLKVSFYSKRLQR